MRPVSSQLQAVIKTIVLKNEINTTRKVFKTIVYVLILTVQKRNHLFATALQPRFFLIIIYIQQTSY
jgi:hypothetical protein